MRTDVLLTSNVSGNSTPNTILIMIKDRVICGSLYSQKSSAHKNINNKKQKRVHHGVYFQIVILLMFLCPSFKSILDNDNNRINDDDNEEERKAW